MKIPIPRPLLIVIVIIVILGVVSCGAGVFRGLNEEPEPSPENAAQDAGIDGLVNGPVQAADIHGDCDVLTGPTRIKVVGACTLRLDPIALLPRVLKIEIDTGSADTGVDVKVTQEVAGETHSPDEKTISPNLTAAPDFKISAAGSSPVFVRLSCNPSCILNVIG